MVGSPGASNQSRLRSRRSLPLAPFLSTILVPPICCPDPSAGRVPAHACRSLSPPPHTGGGKTRSRRLALHRALFLQARDVAVDRCRGEGAATLLVTPQA